MREDLTKARTEDAMAINDLELEDPNEMSMYSHAGAALSQNLDYEDD